MERMDLQDHAFPFHGIHGTQYNTEKLTQKYLTYKVPVCRYWGTLWMLEYIYAILMLVAV